jgi:hypothetical protein
MSLRVRIRRWRCHPRYTSRPVGLRNGEPWCCHCRQRLDWGVTESPWPPRRRKGESLRIARLRIRHAERRYAIRCLDCMRVFCPRCARKHFVPTFRAHARVMQAIDRAKMRAPDGGRE